MLAGLIAKGEFKHRSTIPGWNWTPPSPILNDKCRVNIASSVVFDRANVYVHGGLADVELGRCMEAFHSRRPITKSKELRGCVDTSTFPKRSPNPHHLITATANANNARKGGFTCSGSEPSHWRQCCIDILIG